MGFSLFVILSENRGGLFALKTFTAGRRGRRRRYSVRSSWEPWLSSTGADDGWASSRNRSIGSSAKGASLWH